METVIMLMYAIVCILVLLALLLIRNKVIYNIRISILYDSRYTCAECIENYNKLPSYHEMMVFSSQWYMWTTAQYQKRYINDPV